jgi:hypothetical protein
LRGTDPLREREKRMGEKKPKGGKKKNKRKREWVVGDKEIKKLISIKQSEWWVSWEREMMRISHILIFFIIIFSEFVYGLSHVGLYLG